MGDLEGDVHDEALVMETCRVLDVIDALAAAVELGGVTVSGSRGQVTVNPAVAEMRQQQMSFARLLGQLNLDAEEVGAILSARQASAKRAAQKLWRSRGGDRNGFA
jgi:phage terminase small subunit